MTEAVGYLPRNPDNEITLAAAPVSPASSPPGLWGAPGSRAGDAERLDSWCTAPTTATATRLAFFATCPPEGDPKSPSRLAGGGVTFPEVGGDFCGFKLIAELGRGAFGRVFLSHQGDLADRPVALKVSTEIREESQRLARLQHTNIVPIYSFHRQGSLQAVCMPYFGSATLADVASELSRRDSMPASGKMVASAVHDVRSQTKQTAESRTPPTSPSRVGPAGCDQARRPAASAA